tara:strand:- start:2408 stop:3475 length:1068 start_codon:yes stop_codon:yes gene_type:complete
MINKKFWIGKKVLITGHTGFKGCWLSIWMKILGAKIAGYSLNPITQKNFFNLAKLKRIFEIEKRKNIQDYKSLENFIKKFKPGIIFHLAAQPQVLESFNDPYDTVKTNVIGTTNLLEITKKYKFIKSVVIITTDKVYRNANKKIKFSEDYALGGDDIYSSSKASADIITSSYQKSFFKNSKCGISTARAGNCIGGGDWTKFRIWTDSSEAFLKNKNLLVRNPKSVRPWQHVLEPLLGYIILAQKNFLNINPKFNGSWNFGPVNRKHLNVMDFVNLYKKKMRSKSKIIFEKKSDNREKNYLDLSSNKSIKLLKWKPFLNIDQTLELTANWYLSYKQKKDLFLVSSDQIKYFTKLIK